MDEIRRACTGAAKQKKKRREGEVVFIEGEDDVTVTPMCISCTVVRDENGSAHERHVSHITTQK